MADTTEFRPAWVSAPGETIQDILDERRIPLDAFARSLGHTKEWVVQLLTGQTVLSGEIAKQLEALLGAPAQFWMARESRYRSDISRIEAVVEEEKSARWLSELPTGDMKALGWLMSLGEDIHNPVTFLRFFGVSSVREWRDAYRAVLEYAAFRTSPTFKSDPGAVAAWLRQGEIQSAQIDCEPWNPSRFRDALGQIRNLTKERDPKIFIPALQRICSECGVAVVALQAPSGCKASGATRFLTEKKALILLSFRYLTDDHFWFSFFHEAGHLLLHSESALFLEGADLPSSKEEREANEFAANALIPPEFKAEMLALPLNGREVMRFARRIGIAPGIVVGQLQHSGKLTRRQLNNLKRRYRWTAD